MDAVEYSIGVNNRFKLLEEDEDQTDVVQDSEKSSKDKKEKKAKNVRSVKDAKPQQTKKEKEAVNEETRKDAQNKKGGRVPKDGVKRENEKNTKLSNGPREDRENIPPRGGKGGFNRRRENEGAPEGDSPAKDEKREDRGGSGMVGFGNRGRGGRGGNAGRGRGGFGGPRGGGRKRDFDRRSGSDRSGTEESPGLPTRRSVKPQDKREGGGSFNWGNPTDPHEGEVFDEKKAEWEEPGSPDAEESKPQTEEGQGEEPEESEEQPEETKEMTLEEWKELQGKYRSKMSFEVRKPGEGEKKGQWKNTHVLEKKAVGEDERQQLYEEKIKTSGRVKQKVQGIQFSFVNSESPEPRRGGRGGRGGRGRGGGRGSGRGRGGRGGFGGSRDSGNAEFAINQEEFPTLG